MKCLYNYRITSAINYNWRQFSDTGSANYILWDRIVLLQLHWINIFCHDVRVRWNQRSAMSPVIILTLVETRGSEVQYVLQAAQYHLTVAGIKNTASEDRKYQIVLLLKYKSCVIKCSQLELELESYIKGINQLIYFFWNIFFLAES